MSTVYDSEESVRIPFDDATQYDASSTQDDPLRTQRPHYVQESHATTSSAAFSNLLPAGFAFKVDGRRKAIVENLPVTNTHDFIEEWLTKYVYVAGNPKRTEESVATVDMLKMKTVFFDEEKQSAFYDRSVFDVGGPRREGDVQKWIHMLMKEYIFDKDIFYDVDFIYNISLINDEELEMIKSLNPLYLNIDHYTGHIGICCLRDLVDCMPVDHSNYQRLQKVLQNYPNAIALNDELLKPQLKRFTILRGYVRQKPFQLEMSVVEIVLPIQFNGNLLISRIDIDLTKLLKQIDVDVWIVEPPYKLHKVHSQLMTDTDLKQNYYCFLHQFLALYVTMPFVWSSYDDLHFFDPALPISIPMRPNQEHQQQ